MTDDWTRWKMGETIDLLAKERGCTRERMRLRLNKLDEGRTVVELQRQVQELAAVLEKAEMMMRMRGHLAMADECAASLAKLDTPPRSA